MHKLYPVLLSLLFVACRSRNRQESSDADQKRIEQEHRKVMQQQEQLTSGEDNSMLRDEPASPQDTPQQREQKQKPAGARTNQQSKPRPPSSQRQ